MGYVVAAILGYLLGSIPVALLVAGRHGVDLRQTGDGNPGAWNALEQLGPCSQADLGRATTIDRSDVVDVLGDLDAWGLTRRETDPSDRRRNVVLLTEAGGYRLAP